MKKWAVATINFYDNDLKIEFVQGYTLKDAVIKSSFCSGFMKEDYDMLPSNLDELKEFAFNQDMMIDVKEIV